ncbi:Hypothetical_protein [Hexamita inflata]|uniref:Hypothetical_protein n=1 Tax=Hexamita inflata TaxID=28002 RepID=A0AA86U5U8_9EUKA|nr:Hypothetical protein HINF_LOCUS19083 [Hexamita inflata]
MLYLEYNKTDINGGLQQEYEYTITPFFSLANESDIRETLVKLINSEIRVIILLCNNSSLYFSTVAIIHLDQCCLVNIIGLFWSCVNKTNWFSVFISLIYDNVDIWGFIGLKTLNKTLPLKNKRLSSMVYLNLNT